jgi:outer membrane PBP1 activator LpoA protein
MMLFRAKSVIALGLALLAACSTTPETTPASVEAQAAEARSAADRGDYLRARELYSDLERRSSGDAQSRYRVEVARAEIGLGDAEGALATLAVIPAPRPADLEADIAAVRADALFALGRTVEAVRLLVEREIWLDSAAGILDNQERIWNGLARPESLAAASTTTGDTIIDGWLALAPLIRQSGDATQLRAGLVDWRQRYPGHPATAGILTERLAATRAPGTRVPGIALLLPLTGERRVQGFVVLQGIFAAHFASGHADETAIQVYDTAAAGSAASYQAAQIGGADFIVGPLLADEVAEIQRQAGFLPTLALNVSPAPQQVLSGNFFQYALSSDDEIEAIATRAIAAGHTTAVALISSDDRGYRLRDSFQAAFEARGGRFIGWAAYVGEGEDLSGRIDTLLNASASSDRFRRLRQDLGRAIEFEPRRREDIDMIFMQAAPAAARLLVPLLEDKGAANIATYATSELYDPARTAGDPDLDGVVFPELPMLIDPIGEARTAADLLEEFSSPSVSQLKRLFAFGFDAYLLAQALYAGNGAAWPIAGATGELYLGTDGRIRRILPFAEFNGGRPRAAEPPTGFLSSR